MRQHNDAAGIHALLNEPPKKALTEWWGLFLYCIYTALQNRPRRFIKYSLNSLMLVLVA
jgi:hypothetical protein